MKCAVLLLHVGLCLAVFFNFIFPDRQEIFGIPTDSCVTKRYAIFTMCSMPNDTRDIQLG